MGRYVDGYVIPVKKKNVKSYTKMAKIGYKVWMKHGALDYYECVGAQLKQPWGVDFTKLCKLKKDETVVFAFVVYKSKAHRDAVTKKVHKDPLMDPSAYTDKEMPFDMRRFSVGEFKTLVHS